MHGWLRVNFLSLMSNTHVHPWASLGSYAVPVTPLLTHGIIQVLLIMMSCRPPAHELTSLLNIWVILFSVRTKMLDIRLFMKQHIAILVVHCPCPSKIMSLRCWIPSESSTCEVIWGPKLYEDAQGKAFSNRFWLLYFASDSSAISWPVSECNPVRLYGKLTLLWRFELFCLNVVVHVTIFFPSRLRILSTYRIGRVQLLSILLNGYPEFQTVTIIFTAHANQLLFLIKLCSALCNQCTQGWHWRNYFGVPVAFFINKDMVWWFLLLHNKHLGACISISFLHMIVVGQIAKKLCLLVIKI